ncbi:MAG: LPS export ABC transporter periplasmic protein LptC [Treponema sp.]|uniref:LPS export ABC transporter periplasmic protein LptC n=1 Tax=Treponema sp. TaxID=166 RepID=UPI00298EA94F|nr:LPS export ABC transporter periplasmic protein LptC [Treponema sp.]MCR5385494.1 LPS export ABC transporter periplasmic protein LptC [Treponema sp.]
MKRVRFALLHSAVILILASSLAGCSLKYQSDALAEQNVPQLRLENAVYKKYADNKKNIELKSSVFEQYKGINRSYAKDVEFIIFDSAMMPKSTGKTAIISADTKDQIYTLYDGIEFNDTTQNINIKGDSLKWNGNTEQLVSAKGREITIVKDNLKITGKDFSASAVSNTFLFSSSVKGSQINVGKSGGEDEEITFSGDSMRGSVSSSSDSSKESFTVLSGNAIVKTSTMEIRADSIELTGDDFNIIKARGNISGTNTESELEFKAQTLEYDREQKIVTLTGDVELKDLKNDVTAKAQIIEYDQNTDVAIMQIDVELKQKENVCTGAYSVYRKKEQTLDLSGNASVKQKDDMFRAQSISFNMDTEEIVLDGNIRGTVKTKSGN